MTLNDMSFGRYKKCSELIRNFPNIQTNVIKFSICKKRAKPVLFNLQYNRNKQHTFI